jgi:hypothetical protein
VGELTKFEGLEVNTAAFAQMRNASQGSRHVIYILSPFTVFIPFTIADYFNARLSKIDRNWD